MRKYFRKIHFSRYINKKHSPSDIITKEIFVASKIIQKLSWDIKAKKLVIYRKYTDTLPYYNFHLVRKWLNGGHTYYLYGIEI